MTPSSRWQALRTGAERRCCQRAPSRQLVYQRRKAELARGRVQEAADAMAGASARPSRLETVRSLGPETRVLEVGSGSHGLVFYFGCRRAAGLDPLAVWNALGVRVEIAAFADHTVHLSPRAARALFDGLPLAVVQETDDVEATKANARQSPARGPVDLAKRAFFENARYELVATRDPARAGRGP